MELLIAAGIGVLTAAGVYLLLRERTFSVLLGLTLLSYAVNLFLFATGRLRVDAAPRIRPGIEAYADPLAQALVLTAIVISFAMSAFVVVLAVVANRRLGNDRANPSSAEHEP
jgi:multicomponent K+:H+ antiporter subunit C